MSKILDLEFVSTVVQDLINCGVLEKNTTTRLSNEDVRRSYKVADKFIITVSSPSFDTPVSISQISETYIKKIDTLNQNIMLLETGAWSSNISFNKHNITIFKAKNVLESCKEKDMINWDMVPQTKPIKELIKNNIFSLNEVSRKVCKNIDRVTSVSYIAVNDNIEVIYKSKTSSGSFRVGYIVEHYNSLGAFTEYEIVEFNNIENHKYDHDLRFIHVFKEIVL